MKKTDFIKKLSDQTKIPADKLTEIFASDKEEVEIDLPELHVYTDDELETLKINLNKASSKTAVEMAVKAARNKLVEQYGDEYSFTDKTPEALMEYALKAGEKKAGAKPNEQLAEKEKIIKNLQNTVQQLESEKVQVINEKNQVLLDYEINSTITKAIPSDLDTIWGPEEIAELWKKNHQIVIEDGKKMVKMNGEILRDKKTQEPIPVEAAVSSWLGEKGVTKKNAKGRGEGDGPGKPSGSEFRSIDDILDYAEKNKLNNEQQVELTRKFYKENPNYGM